MTIFRPFTKEITEQGRLGDKIHVLVQQHCTKTHVLVQCYCTRTCILSPKRPCSVVSHVKGLKMVINDRN